MVTKITRRSVGKVGAMVTWKCLTARWLLVGINYLNQGVRFGFHVSQIGKKWDKSGTF